MPAPIVIGRLPKDIDARLREGDFGFVRRNLETGWAITWFCYEESGDAICTCAVVPPEEDAPTVIWCGTARSDWVFMRDILLGPSFPPECANLFWKLMIGHRHRHPGSQFWEYVQDLYQVGLTEDDLPVWNYLEGRKSPTPPAELKPSAERRTEELCRLFKRGLSRNEITAFARGRRWSEAEAHNLIDILESETPSI